jgi:TetR/AcrR family transcriptional regulator, transcriptional repressor for nem operon
MRKSKAEKALTRQHIVEVAARMFKSGGIGATGVGEIMVAAGLTHSAFYRHFASKEELVAEASSASMDVFVEAARQAMEAGPDAFTRYLENYLSSEYRNGALGGCPVVQTGSELARADAQTRQGVSDGLEQLIGFALKLTDGSAEAEEQVILTMSAVTGAIAISRLVNDSALAEHVIDVVRRSLSKPAAAAAKPARVAGKAPARQRGAQA